MLDGVELGGLGKLNTVAGYFLGSAVVFLVIGIGAGIAMWLAGRNRSGNNLSSKGLTTVGVALVGAIVLGGAGGAVQWGSELGDSNLMPQAARQQNLTIEKEAASVTCKTVTKTFLDRDSNSDPTEVLADMYNTHEESVVWVKALVGPEYENAPPIRALASDNPLESVSWHPDGDGGDCTTANQTVADCTTVKIKPFMDTGDTVRTDIRIGGQNCAA